MTDRPILIAGGGIGGLAAACAMSIAGQKTIVIEQAPVFEEIGAGIQIGPNGFRMIETLGIRTAVDNAAVFPDDLIVMDGVSAQEVTRIPVGDDFRARFGQPYALIHRADLHRALLDRCTADPNIELRAGTTYASHRTGADRVLISCAGGEAFEAAGLIGADGLWSRIRNSLVADGAPRVSGHIAYRAVLPIEEIEPRFRNNAMILWAGPSNHLVQYPLRGGKLFNLVAVFHSDKFVDGWDREGDPEELKLRFSENCDIVKTLLGKVETWRMWVLCDRDPAKSWSDGRVTMLGDAAHPMLQYLAQGAGMAMEDGVVMAQALVRAKGDVPSAFTDYAERRYLRTGRCQIMARIYGGFYHAKGATRELATQFLSARTVSDSYESLSWLYDFDPGPIGSL